MTFNEWWRKAGGSYAFAGLSRQIFKPCWNAAIKAVIKRLEEDEWARETEFALRDMKELIT